MKAALLAGVSPAQAGGRRGRPGRVPGRIAMLAMASLLAACGGGSIGGADGVNDVPQAALESPQAFAGYVASLRPDDRAEPIAIDGLMPPVSDTDEPIER